MSDDYKLVGIGNIYASEILFHSAIHPEQKAGSLLKPQIQKLHRAIKAVLRSAIKYCGTTFSDFQTTTGSEGSFQNFLQVYDRENKPCRKCKTPIQRIQQQGRSTFFCGHCQQKLTRRKAP